MDDFKPVASTGGRPRIPTATVSRRIEWYQESIAELDKQNKEMAEEIRLLRKERDVLKECLRKYFSNEIPSYSDCSERTAQWVGTYGSSDSGRGATEAVDASERDSVLA